MTGSNSCLPRRKLRARLAHWGVAAVLLLAGLSRQPVFARPIHQASPPPRTNPTQESPPADQPAVYIVQPGDTLFSIAEHHGVSLDLLVAANDIADPARISVGQRLIIPSPPEHVEPVLVHLVEPGDTLHSVSLRFGLSPLELARANHLVHPEMLFAGTGVSVLGQSTEPPPLYGQTHVVRNGETLIGLALQFGQSPWALAAANQLASPLYASPGSRLWVPDPTLDTVYLDWSFPALGIRLYPLPAVQGETVALQISTTLTATLSGALDSAPLYFHADAQGQTALLGVGALEELGIHNLVVTSTLPSGMLARYVQRIPIIAGEYSAENVVVSESIAAAMTPEVVVAEFELLDQLFSLQSNAQRWQGFFALPASGDITSVFGTRRTYNIPEASAYHTGTDFGAPVGTPVYAPADGTVVYTGSLTVRGTIIIIDHGWGVMTGYWHLSASHIQAGDSVVQGQHIADTGNSGLSTGPHLHWEMRVGNVPVSALQWVWQVIP